MGKHRFPSEARKSRFKLWSSPADPKGLRVLLHNIQFAVAEAMVMSGRAERVRDGDGLMLGYRQRADQRIKVEPVTWKLVEGEMSRSGVLTFEEVEAATGMHGKSRTAGLSEEQREMLVRQGRPAEDHIERATAKARQYARDCWRHSSAREAARQLGRVLE